MECPEYLYITLPLGKWKTEAVHSYSEPQSSHCHIILNLHKSRTNPFRPTSARNCEAMIPKGDCGTPYERTYCRDYSKWSIRFIRILCSRLVIVGAWCRLGTGRSVYRIELGPLTFDISHVRLYKDIDVCLCRRRYGTRGKVRFFLHRIVMCRLSFEPCQPGGALGDEGSDPA